MRTTPLRRGSGALLLAALLAACSDTPTAPTSPTPPDPAPVGGVYRQAFSVLPLALFRAQNVALNARGAGASLEAAAAEARLEAGVLLRAHEVPVDIGDGAGNEDEALSVLTPGQRMYLDQIGAAVADLGPGVSPDELERRLARVEAGARAELSDAEREPVLMAIAAVAEFWHAAAPTAQLSLLPAGPLESSAMPLKKGTFSWGRMATSVAKGAILGAVGGAVGGARIAGGAGALLGGTMGAIGGAVTGGLDYLMEEFLV